MKTSTVINFVLIFFILIFGSCKSDALNKAAIFNANNGSNEDNDTSTGGGSNDSNTSDNSIPDDDSYQITELVTNQFPQPYNFGRIGNTEENTHMNGSFNRSDVNVAVTKNSNNYSINITVNKKNIPYSSLRMRQGFIKSYLDPSSAPEMKTSWKQTFLELAGQEPADPDQTLYILSNKLYMRPLFVINLDPDAMVNCAHMAKLNSIVALSKEINNRVSQGVIPSGTYGSDNKLEGTPFKLRKSRIEMRTFSTPINVCLDNFILPSEWNVARTPHGMAVFKASLTQENGL